MVDDNIVNAGFNIGLCMLLKPLLRRILYIWVCNAANTFTSLVFPSRVKLSRL